MPEKRRYDPRQRRAHRAHCVLRNFIERRQPRPLLERFFQRTARSGNNQLFLGTRQRNIEHAQLLADHLAALPHRDRGALGRVVLHAAPQIAALGAEAQLLVHQNRLAQINFIEQAGTARNEYDRELQALGLVDGQDAHRTAYCLRADGLEVLTGLYHAAQQPHEGKQAAIAALLEYARPLEKGQQIALPLRAVRQRAVQAERTRAVVDLPQQTVNRLVDRERTQVVQLLQEQFDLIKLPA